MRQIQAPGIELNEYDRSQYNVQRSALDGAPYCLICGFSDKGDNYSIKYIDSRSVLRQTFGLPQTEFEKYFYNGCLEVIQNGGICLASRLPYDNESLDKYTYCDYTVSTQPQPIGNIVDIEQYSRTLKGLHDAVHDLASTCIPFSTSGIASRYSLSTLKDIKDCLHEMQDLCQQLELTDESMHALQSVEDLLAAAEELAELVAEQNQKDFCQLRMLDSDLTSCIQISADTSSNGTGKMTMKQLDDLRTGNAAAVRGKMRIVDISRSNYTQASQATVSSLVESDCSRVLVETNDCLGIVPVVVSPANALYFQELLSQAGADSETDGQVYSEMAALSVVSSPFMHGDDPTLTVDLSALQDPSVLTMPYASSSPQQQSVSRVAALQFPSIAFRDAEHLDTAHLKSIGIAVFRAYRDDANSGQVSFQLLESYVGSLDRDAKDQTTGASIYIDKIVNTQSQTINVFTNISPAVLQQSSIIVASGNTATSLGFYQLDLVKKISVGTSVLDALSKVLAKAGNPNEYPLDLIADAGVSNIAQWTASRGDARPSSFVYKLQTAEDTKIWQTVLKKLDDFCKYTRKDCMLIADGHRGFCLLNDSKIVRDTDPSSSVQASILPKLRLMSGINSSYSAGYCNWFLARDEYSGDYFWCPPSIKVLRSYIYCDTYCQPWSVPAGMNRGHVQGAVDVAFQPTVEEAGKIYSQTWNYAVSYPADGIIIEGQKTFQRAYTALDRVNVRRLMLYLEKQTVRIARHFLYEGNTAYMRQQFVDAITPVFDDAVNNNGIIEYAIKCDDELNTPHVIDNNEMRCKIAVKPVKALEFLVLDFIVTNQTADVREEVRR